MTRPPQDPGNRSADRRLRPSVLDRLLGSHDERPDAGVPALRSLRNAVQRDVEALLNTRRSRLPLPPGFDVLQTSLLAYGIPDPKAGSYALADCREALAQEIAMTINRFEPRLVDVSVRLADPGEPLQHAVHMHVQAVLRLNGISEKVTLETVLEPITRQIKVRAI